MQPKGSHPLLAPSWDKAIQLKSCRVFSLYSKGDSRYKAFRTISGPAFPSDLSSSPILSYLALGFLLQLKCYQPVPQVACFGCPPWSALPVSWCVAGFLPESTGFTLLYKTAAYPHPSLFLYPALLVFSRLGGADTQKEDCWLVW